MMTDHNSAVRWTLGLAVIVLMIVGCGRFDAPTASETTNDTYSELWNPVPGEQVVPGRDVPILKEGYWRTQYGEAINPFGLPTASAVIGPAGGVLRLGRHSLMVPPGAVDHNIAFTMRYASWTGVGVDCTPSPFTFNVPVTLTLSYWGTTYEPIEEDGDGGDPPPPPTDLEVIYLAPDGSFDEQPSSVDATALTVSAQLDHFSRYIIS